MVFDIRKLKDFVSTAGPRGRHAQVFRQALVIEEADDRGVRMVRCAKAIEG
jgi:hypothetical protein